MFANQPLRNGHPTLHIAITPNALLDAVLPVLHSRNQDIIMVYDALIKVDIYGVGLANTRAQL
jgi:hypothetical protein